MLVGIERGVNAPCRSALIGSSMRSHWPRLSTYPFSSPSLPHLKYLLCLINAVLSPPSSGVCNSWCSSKNQGFSC